MHHWQVDYRREQASGIIWASRMAALVLVHLPCVGFRPWHCRCWGNRMVADAAGHQLAFPRHSDALKHLLGLLAQALPLLFVEAALLA